MRTAHECLLHQAEHCEDLARACVDRINQDMLFETAQYWRHLAKNSERDEKRAKDAE